MKMLERAIADWLLVISSQLFFLSSFTIRGFWPWPKLRQFIFIMMLTVLLYR
jgi:hypothetical protein